VRLHDSVTSGVEDERLARVYDRPDDVADEDRVVSDRDGLVHAALEVDHGFRNERQS
jgi:hypothetical protein